MTSRCFRVGVTGAKICVDANPLPSDSRKRSRERIARVFRLHLDFDIDGDARLTSLRTSEALPTSVARISTSASKCQVLLRIDCGAFVRQESTPTLLTIAFGDDPSCSDLARVFRQPGFLSYERDPAYSVAIKYYSDCMWNSDDFWLDIAVANAMLLPSAISPRKQHDERTNSQCDWAWVVHELGVRKDAEKTYTNTGRPLFQCSPVLFSGHSGESMPQSSEHGPSKVSRWMTLSGWLMGAATSILPRIFRYL